MEKQVKKRGSTTLPPISDLFKESWVTFKGSVLNLFILGIVVYVVSFVVLLAGILISLPFGIFSVVTTMNSHKFGPGFFTSLGIIGVIIVIVIIAMIILSLVSQAAGILFVGNFKNKPEFGKTFKQGFSFVLKLFLVGLLSGLIVMGGYFFLGIPGILFAFLFSFVPYEIVLNKQGVISSMKRSMKIVLSHFWGIVLRLIILIVGIVILAFLPYLSIGNNSAQAGLSFLSTIVNIVLGWFAIAYSLTLYRQAAKGLESSKGSSLVLPVIVAVVGWIVGILTLIGFAFVAVFFLQDLVKKNAQPKKIYKMYDVQIDKSPIKPIPTTSFITNPATPSGR